jgi:hypothetical protein
MDNKNKEIRVQKIKTDKKRIKHDPQAESARIIFGSEKSATNTNITTKDK